MSILKIDNLGPSLKNIFQGGWTDFLKKGLGEKLPKPMAEK